MNGIDQFFRTSSVRLPVVHPVGRAEALEAVRVASRLDVRGVFLIDQGMHQKRS